MPGENGVWDQMTFQNIRKGHKNRGIVDQRSIDDDDDDYDDEAFADAPARDPRPN